VVKRAKLVRGGKELGYLQGKTWTGCSHMKSLKEIPCWTSCGRRNQLYCHFERRSGVRGRREACLRLPQEHSDQLAADRRTHVPYAPHDLFEAAFQIQPGREYSISTELR